MLQAFSSSPETIQTRSISVLVPAKNEGDNLPTLLGEIETALKAWDFEIIVVDDGSTDHTADSLKDMIAGGAQWLRLIKHSESAGQSAAIRTALLAATKDIIVTIDGDGQNDPAFIPALVDALLNAGIPAGLSAGQRVGRKASGAKRWASRTANKLRGKLLKDKTRDSGCGLKAIYRHIFLQLPYFDGWHRYLPALVMRERYNVVHVDVIDRPRQYGMSKYGVVDRALIGVLDLIGVWWLLRRRKVTPQVSEITPTASEESVAVSSDKKAN
jgi:dolichol-phosphate mannosyltransferase